MLTNTIEVGPRPVIAKAASPGRVYWITGLSGAGKTTVGRELWSRLRAAGHRVIFLDGDALRATIADDLGHGRMIGGNPRCAMRDCVSCWPARGLMSSARPSRCFTRCSVGTARTSPVIVRSTSGSRSTSYGVGTARESTRRLSAAMTCDVVGLDLPAETPEAPDLVLDNYGATRRCHGG